MPRFEYKCPDCEESLTLSHARGESRAGSKCPNCGSETGIQRVYAFNVEKTRQGRNKPGTLVKSHIEEAKQELRKEKEKLAKKEFEI